MHNLTTIAVARFKITWGTEQTFRVESTKLTHKYRPVTHLVSNFQYPGLLLIDCMEFAGIRIKDPYLSDLRNYYDAMLFPRIEAIVGAHFSIEVVYTGYIPLGEMDGFKRHIEIGFLNGAH